MKPLEFKPIFEEWLGDQPFHPWWSFEVVHHFVLNDLKLVVRQMTLSILDPEKFVSIGGEETVPDAIYWGTIEEIDWRYLGYFVHDAILKVQMHEIDEWLVLGGKRHKEPHPRQPNHPLPVKGGFVPKERRVYPRECPGHPRERTEV